MSFTGEVFTQAANYVSDRLNNQEPVVITLSKAIITKYSPDILWGI